MAHSYLGGSVMQTRRLCPGSYAVAKQALEQDESLYSAEGTATHWVGEQCLLSKGELIPSDFLETMAPNGVFIRESLIDAPTEYVEHVRKTLAELGVCESEGTPEKRVDLAWVDAEMFGTSDFHYFHEATKTVYIWDYKNGYEYVDAFDNPQLPFYALGDYERAERAVCFISQPNAGGIRCAEFTKAELWQWVLEFRKIAEECRKPNAARKAGTHCKFCMGKIVCPENIIETWSLYGDARRLETINPTPEELSNEADAIDLAIDMLKQRRQAVATQAFRLAYDYGKAIPRRKLVQSTKTRKWVDEEAIVAACEMLNIDPYERKLKSPAKLQKQLDVSKYSETPDGEPKLVKQSQRGTPISSHLQERFKNVRIN